MKINKEILATLLKYYNAFQLNDTNKTFVTIILFIMKFI